MLWMPRLSSRGALFGSSTPLPSRVDKDVEHKEGTVLRAYARPVAGKRRAALLRHRQGTRSQVVDVGGSGPSGRSDAGYNVPGVPETSRPRPGLALSDAVRKGPRHERSSEEPILPPRSGGKKLCLPLRRLLHTRRRHQFARKK